MREELLSEEEALKLLKVNKVQLENYVREGRLTPLYQESVRKFKLSDVSRITVETPVPPIASTEEEPPFIKTQKEGSTRIIEPPKETTRIGISKTGAKGTTFESEQETEKFLKQLDETVPTTTTQQGNLTLILLSSAFVISAFSIFMLTFTLQGKELQPINKILSSIGVILPIDKAEITRIENETNSVIQAAQQTKQAAEVFKKGTDTFINTKVE